MTTEMTETREKLETDVRLLRECETGRWAAILANPTLELEGNGVSCAPCGEYPGGPSCCPPCPIAQDGPNCYSPASAYKAWRSNPCLTTALAMHDAIVASRVRREERLRVMDEGWRYGDTEVTLKIYGVAVRCSKEGKERLMARHDQLKNLGMSLCKDENENFSKYDTIGVLRQENAKLRRRLDVACAARDKVCARANELEIELAGRPEESEVQELKDRLTRKEVERKCGMCLTYNADAKDCPKTIVSKGSIKSDYGSRCDSWIPADPQAVEIIGLRAEIKRLRGELELSHQARNNMEIKLRSVHSAAELDSERADGLQTDVETLREELKRVNAELDRAQETAKYEAVRRANIEVDITGARIDRDAAIRNRDRAFLIADERPTKIQHEAARCELRAVSSRCDAERRRADALQVEVGERTRDHAALEVCAEHLRKYARHHEDCAKRVMVSSTACTCGFNEGRNAENVQEEPKRQATTPSLEAFHLIRAIAGHAQPLGQSGALQDVVERCNALLGEGS